ncbi:MAG: RNA polymerase sigma-70 factor [Prevotella sp.]|jgi:RNA polymerase sigma-70 factor (ECF subfamily)|nr:RNA polymerase sigma-70 factor [Prevotella sp.]
MLYNKPLYKNISLCACNQNEGTKEEIIPDTISLQFSNIYINYYPKLIRFAKEYVGINEDAENIVQDIFLRVWERQDTICLIENINAYLFRLVKNKCVDYLRYRLSTEKYNKTVQNSFEAEMNLKIQSLDRFDDSFMSEKSMEDIVNEAINSLPPKCREIFLLSRIEGLKYREISERFGISVNTVENQMSIALKKLRVKLKGHLSL